MALRVRQNPAARALTMRSKIVFSACKTTVGVLSALSVAVSPMASEGKSHSCFLVQSPETNPQIMHVENEIVDARIE